MKRALTAVLVALMVVSFAATAFAATGEIAGPAFNDIAGHEAEGDLTLMGALGIMSGDEGIGGPVRPNDSITRAEFSKMIVGGLGKGTLAGGLGGLRPTFGDEIPSWAWGWVNAAYFMGLMIGDDKGNFRPNDPINYAEVLTVMVRAVRGHEQQLPAGIWPYNYLFYAVDNGFAGSVDVGFPRLPATRGDVASLVFAMMQVDRLDKNGVAEEASAMLANRVCEGMFTGYSATQVTIGGYTYNLADKLYLVGASDYEGLMNLNVRAVANAAGKVAFIQVIESANSFAGAFADYIERDASVAGEETLKFDDGTEIKMAAGMTVSLNRAEAATDVALEAGDECAVILNASGAAAHVVAYRVTVGEVYLDSVTKSNATTGTATTISVAGGSDFEVPSTARVTINGQSAGRDDLAAYDVVRIYNLGDDTSEDVIRVEATRQVVQGTVKGSSTSYPGPRYYVTLDRGTAGTATYEWKVAGQPLPAAGTIVKLGLNAAGQLFAPIGFTSTTPYVVVKSFTVDGAGNMTVTVDSRGQQMTYVSEVDLRDEIGHFGLAEIDGATNKVTDFDRITIAASPEYEVMSFDAARGTMTLKNLTSSAILFISDTQVTIYDADHAYVGFDGLAVGQTLNADASLKIWVIGE